MLAPVKNSFPFCPLESKSTNTFDCFHLNIAWSVHISLLIQMRQLVHWRKQYYGYKTHDGFVSRKLKTFCFKKHYLMDWSCGLLWCFDQLFGLSFVWHLFIAEDPLMTKWCNATFLQICSENKNILHLVWPEDEYIFKTFKCFEWTIHLIANMQIHFFWNCTFGFDMGVIYLNS